MFSPRVKIGALVLEGLNALATTIYFSYLYFYMRDRFGFTNLENLSLAALNGLVYSIAVWFAGKFAQNRGYFFALRLGFGTMAVATGIAGLAQSVPGHVGAALLCSLGMSLTWPTLEAIVSEHESPARLKHLLGVYNVVWAVCGAAAYFMGGAMIEQWGHSSIFLVPSTIHFAQVLLTIRIAPAVNPSRPIPVIPAPPPPHGEGLASEAERHRSLLPPRRFLLMAWVANPFCYIAINAMLPVIPKIAERFSLGPMLAGFFCSTWFFARTLGFVGLWRWDGWHYRFRWLLSAYVLMVLGFLGVLIGRQLWLLLAAQVVFGLAVALAYYSSLFYSMDVGETKGEHGGFHEAALGAGICTGPAVGALSLRFFPQHTDMHAWAVAGLLVAGMIWLLALRYARAPRSA
ncbi:MAG TPA: MFS transporter [Candidatus Paceibacterota bacterium]|nr:MFS transporter [Candidatus Paceibacterota bacterium]HRZ55009.1 MFS transporter [Candidatus Paceibacterota bacterium]